MQVTAVETVIFDPECEGKLLVVGRTSGGKSHILRMIATFIGGIIVVIVPLLALTVDQMAKIEVSLQDCGSVTAVHLNELTGEQINGEVLPRMHEIDYNFESTMYIFTSPQFF